MFGGVNEVCKFYTVNTDTFRFDVGSDRASRTVASLATTYHVNFGGMNGIYEVLDL